MNLVRQLLPLFLLGLLQLAQAEVTLAPVFGSNMVLQHGQPVPVWGTGVPGSPVSVSFAGQTASTQVDAAGRWKVSLKPLPIIKEAGSFVVRSGDNQTILENVLVGDVWICSGQSNMEWPVQKSNAPAEEMARAHFPNIRLYVVPKNPQATPAPGLPSSWQACSPESVRTFSAVAYFFGREIHQATGTPIGLIGTYWGGTPAEAWTRLEALQDNPDFSRLVNVYQASLASSAPDPKLEQSRKILQEWVDRLAQIANKPPATPPYPYSYSGKVPGSDKDWKSIELPAAWEATLGNFDGVVSFVRELDLPPGLSLEGATLFLGSIDDFDATWVNGRLVGQTDTRTQNAHVSSRAYPLPSGLLQPGKNHVTVRVVDWLGGGGFTGGAGDMKLVLASGESYPLAGTWQCHVDLHAGIRPPDVGKKSPQNTSSYLYNGMIAPLIPYAIRGAIWYQGESNAGRAVQYRTLFPRMISNWRQDWNQGDFPFYFVQLANFQARAPFPGNSEWAELRESQRHTLALPETGMAVAIDVGEAKDIHPRDKQSVGYRLARIALSRDYGVTEPQPWAASLPLLRDWFRQPLTPSGPLYRSHTIEGGTIRLKFDHASGLHASEGQKIKGFAIAGPDQKFVWADAEIHRDELVVSSGEIPQPVAVRYAWAANPECNLVNGAGLPASPFRTDDWPLMTEGKN